MGLHVGLQTLLRLNKERNVMSEESQRMLRRCIIYLPKHEQKICCNLVSQMNSSRTDGNNFLSAVVGSDRVLTFGIVIMKHRL